MINYLTKKYNMIEYSTQRLKSGDKMGKKFINIYNKVGNEKYNTENKNDLTFNDKIKISEEDKKGETNFEKWMKKYKLAESYYEHYGNLEIPIKFKTTNGYEYDEEGINLGIWIVTQISAYKGQGNHKLTEEQIKLLEKIEIKWFNNNIDKKLQSEIINEQNKTKKQKEILNRVRSYLNILDENKVYSKEELNSGFVKKLKIDKEFIDMYNKVSNEKYNTETKNDLNFNIEIKNIEEDKKCGANFEKWMKKYKLAESYYKHHGHSNIPQNFKTTNGYEYDEESINLGSWINNQRNAYKGQGNCKLTEEQKKLLEKIGMVPDVHSDNWQKKYKLAESYYKHHGHSNIPKNFKTTNGYEYNEQGVELGIWIIHQRQAYKGQGTNKLTEEQKKLLEKIGMVPDVHSDNWMKKYKLAEFYYNHYGHLNIPQNFKTTNGYEYDEQGVELGIWISTQRQAYKGQGTNKLTKEQKKLLEKIGMVPDVHSDNWMKKYKLAESYYEHHGNLEIPVRFKTTNGYEYDEEGINLGNWINTQRNAYKGQGTHKLTEQQIKLLEKIEIKWFDNNIDKKLQSEIINRQNKTKKQVEILNRVKSYLNTLDENKAYSKEEINLGFVKKLNK